MPAPAPCATTSEATASASPTKTALHGPREATSIVKRSSGPPIACHHAWHERDRHPVPRHVGLRLSGVEARRLLPRGTEEPRDALVLLVAVDVCRDQLHLPSLPDREDADDVARTGPGGVRVHAEGEPAHHALQATARRGRGRP